MEQPPLIAGEKNKELPQIDREYRMEQRLLTDEVGINEAVIPYCFRGEIKEQPLTSGV